MVPGARLKVHLKTDVPSMLHKSNLEPVLLIEWLKETRNQKSRESLNIF